MKTPAKIISLLAATCFAFVSLSKAQLQTYQTVQPVDPSSGYSGSVLAFNGGSRATQGEVFTNVLAIDSMTYNFFTTGTSSAAQLSATFGQWNPITHTFVGTTLNLGTINVPASTSWAPLVIGINTYNTFTASFDITTANSGLYTTNPSLDYALMLTQITPGNLNFGVGLTNAESDFAYGFGSFGTGVPAGADFTFAQIVVTPNPTIPEPSTVASILAGVLVAGLVGFRLRQRRQLALAPIAA